MGIDDNTATDESMQGVTDKLESILFERPNEEEPKQAEEDEGSEDAIVDELPEDADSDSEEDEGSDEEGLEDIAEDLTLAGYLGIDDERIVEGEGGQYMFNAIIDGETKPVPLSDLAASYQLQGHVNNKSMALETERKEFDEGKNQAIQELQQRVQGVSKLSELAEQELVGEYNSIDWDRLRTEDPANWTALRQEYAERAQKIQQVQKLSAEESQRIQAEQAEKFKVEADKYFAEQQRAMIADNPEWADNSVRTEKLSEIKHFLSNYGFTEQDAQGVNDHRLIRLIKDAQAYRSGKAAVSKKRVKKDLPKFQKPGSNRGNAESLAKAREVKARKAKAKKTGRVQDVAASILDRM